MLRHDIIDFFAPLQGPVYKGFDQWQGADVAIATGWQTVHATLALDHCRARAYIVNDHEPEFYATSTERALAEDTYRHDLHCIAASPWLRDLLIERYGASADAFQLGVDGDTYQPRAGRAQARHRRLLRAPRDAAARGADRADGARGAAPPPAARADRAVRHRQARCTPRSPTSTSACSRRQQLARLYSEATAGLCLSMTNFSLMPKEMLACGLPCVELAGVSAESIFGADGPLDLAPLEPQAIADALERLLVDPERWERALARRHRVRRLAHLGARDRRGRSGPASRAARAETTATRSASPARRRARAAGLAADDAPSGEEAAQREQLRCIAQADHRHHERGRERHVPAAAETERAADRDRGERRDRREDVAALFGENRAAAAGGEERGLDRDQHTDREEHDHDELKRARERWARSRTTVASASRPTALIAAMIVS